MSHKDIKSISDAYLSIYESEEQLDEVSRSRRGSSRSGNYDVYKEIEKAEANLIDALMDFQHHAANIASEKESNDIYNSFISNLKKRVRALESGKII